MMMDWRRALRLLFLLAAIVLLLILGVYIFTGAYRVPLRKEIVPQEVAKWVGGSTLLKQDPAKLAQKYGFKIIHQSWKTEYVPVGVLTKNFISWSQMHPDALHVLWTDEDNDELVKTHYREFESLYFSRLLTKVQRADIARIMYLHRYGGVYVDLDYEARKPLFEHLPDTKAGIMVVRSPTMLNEVMQNSLMIAKEPKQEFWYKVLVSTVETVSFIDNPEECFKNKWSGCDDMMMFHNPLTRKATNLIFSGFMTGPAILDRTFALYRSGSWDPKWQIELLPLQEFFVGTVAKHYQLSTWVSILYVVREVIFLIVLGVIAAFVAGALSMRWYLEKKSGGKYAGMKGTV